MRDPNRLDELYLRMKEIHQEKVPDWRIGQFMLNFMSWYGAKYKRDMFYIEDNQFVDAIETYFEDIKKKD